MCWASLPTEWKFCLQKRARQFCPAPPPEKDEYLLPPPQAGVLCFCFFGFVVGLGKIHQGYRLRPSASPKTKIPPAIPEINFGNRSRYSGLCFRGYFFSNRQALGWVQPEHRNFPMKLYHQYFRSFFFCLFTLALILGNAAISRGATLVTSAILHPIADTHVHAGFTLQKKNFGQEPIMDLQHNEAEIYMRFSLAEADILMKQAKLRFYAGAESAAVVTVEVRSVAANDWSENLVTWKEKPEQGGTLGSVQLVGTTPAWYEVDVTEAVKAEIDASGQNISFALVATDADGTKLTINSKESVDNKPELVMARTPTKIRVVFRPTETGAPPGYIVDTGAVYSPHTNGFTYGWNQDMQKFLADRNNPAQAAPKQSRSPDSRYACVAAMDHPELEKPAFWGIAVPNGKYNVHLVAGDPGFYDSVYALNVNDAIMLEGIPDASKRWVEATKVISVTNQKIIVTNNPKGINNKLCFIEIQEVRESGK